MLETALCDSAPSSIRQRAKLAITLEYEIALFQYAAEALIHGYLAGRILPEATHRKAVHVVEQRLIKGMLPLLDASLKTTIDDLAVVDGHAFESVAADL